jgi:hypothetical protein
LDIPIFDRNLVISYFALFLKSLLTFTSILAIFGPSILSLNYNLFIGHVGDFRLEKTNLYSGLFRTKWIEIIDTQFGHSFDLNALIIVWGAFAYQILSNPIYNIHFLLYKIKVFYSLNSGLQSIDNCWINKFPTYGDSINECINFISTDPLSIVVITLAIGFVIWIFRRLISGELSQSKTVELYEKYESNGQLKNKYFLLSSRITLYRYMFVLFSFLYLAWSEYYIQFNVSKNNISQEDAEKYLNTALSSFGIPNNPNYIIFILYLILFFFTIIIGHHYLSLFGYEITKKIKRSKKM